MKLGWETALRMKEMALLLTLLFPSPTLPNILPSDPLASLSSISLLPASPPLPSLADIRDDLLSLLEGPKAPPSPVRPESGISGSSQALPRLPSPVLQSGGWIPLPSKTSPPPNSKPSTEATQDQQESQNAFELSFETTAGTSPPVIVEQQQQFSSNEEVISSKKGASESEEIVKKVVHNADDVEKKIHDEETDVKYQNVLWREDIVNSGRLLKAMSSNSHNI